ncbi:MAG: hypothetical protein JJ866_19665 [Roseibium sp.]|nr:hypothetical protein [Roseibium sp.]MBO6932027.1 hypothetical protein [Roseibium sp.]
MMKLLMSTVAMVVVATGLSYANGFQMELEELAAGDISGIASSAEVIAAVKAQNEATAAFDQAKVDELDQTWRAETKAPDKPMIDAMMKNDLSRYLAGEQKKSVGLFTEIFVMDAKGLNVGQSAVTSDYWQGDEAKWQETYLKGAGAVHVGELEQDDSTQQLQSQVSVSVVDPDSGETIGAVTFGVNVGRL